MLSTDIIEQSKCSLLMLEIIHILALLKKLIVKILNLKFVIMLEYQNTKTFLLKDVLQIGLKKFLSLNMLKVQFHD